MRRNQRKPRTGKISRALRYCDVIHGISLIIGDDFVPDQRKSGRGACGLVAAIVNQVVRNDTSHGLQICAGGDDV